MQRGSSLLFALLPLLLLLLDFGGWWLWWTALLCRRGWRTPKVTICNCSLLLLLRSGCSYIAVVVIFVVVVVVTVVGLAAAAAEFVAPFCCGNTAVTAAVYRTHTHIHIHTKAHIFTHIYIDFSASSPATPFSAIDSLNFKWVYDLARSVRAQSFDALCINNTIKCKLQQQQQQ